MSADSKPAKASLKDYAFYCAYKLMCMVFKLVDIRIIAIAGRMAGYLVWAAMPSRRRIVARNLRIILGPSMRPRKLAPMVRRNIVRTTMNLACSLKTGLMKNREMARSIRVEGGDVFEAHGSGGHTVISCIPHAGNWEILARIRPLFSKVEHFGSMYRRLTNPLLEAFVYKSRTRYGCEMYSKEDGLRAVMKVARSGGLLGVLSDQFTGEGLYLPYFGKITGVTPLPALLYKRCKGKGHLFSVFTRNVSLGRWVAELGRIIHLPEGCDSLPAITMQVNLALEACQRENILDGFWMHHRWKSLPRFAFEADAETLEAIRTYGRLPFRMILCPPEEEEHARCLVPVARALSTSRPDAELTVLCPTAQVGMWQALPCVANIITTDGAESIAAQFDAEPIYSKGPFDMLFMFSDNRRVFKQLKPLFPLGIMGWASSPLARRIRWHYKSPAHPGHPTAEDYAAIFLKYHNIEVDLSEG